VACGLPVDGPYEDVPTFFYRDFQARNVMLRDNEPHFIDFREEDVARFIMMWLRSYGMRGRATVMS
jgi:hypothetical protein